MACCREQIVVHLTAYRYHPISKRPSSCTLEERSAAAMEGDDSSLLVVLSLIARFAKNATSLDVHYDGRSNVSCYLLIASRAFGEARNSLVEMYIEEFAMDETLLMLSNYPIQVKNLQSYSVLVASSLTKVSQNLHY
jgi:hypothetical protein